MESLSPVEATMLAVKAVAGTLIAQAVGPYLFAFVIAAWLASRSEARGESATWLATAYFVTTSAIVATLVAAPFGYGAQMFVEWLVPKNEKSVEWSGYVSPVIAAYLGNLGYKRVFELLPLAITDIWRRFFPRRSEP